MNSRDEIFRIAFEKHSAIMLLINPASGIILEANQAAVNFYGYPANKLCGMSIERINRLTPEQVKTQRLKALENKQNMFIFEHTLANGNIRTVEVHSTPIDWEGGQVLFSIIHDITERAWLEKGLSAMAVRYQTILETANDGIHILDTQGKLVEANEEFCRMLGYSREEIMQLNISDWDAQSDQEELMLRIDTLIHTPALFETIHRRKDGTLVHMEINAIGVFLDGQKYLYAAARDITERKKMEQDLQAERDFATQIVNNMGQGLTVTNVKGEFEFVNPAYANLFGYASEELIGRHPDELSHPDDYKDLSSELEKRKKGITSTYEARLKRKDGSIANVLITGVPRKTSTGEFAGTIAVITDLSRQKSIEEELRRTKHSLEKAFAREQELANTDTLTGIHNRRSLFEFAERKLAIAIRYKQSLATMMFDIDHFKNVNDTYGHSIGDLILREVTRIVKDELRKADTFGRYGGEEFIVLLPMTSAKQAYSLAERIRHKVASLKVPSEKGEVSITLSIGVVELSHNAREENPEDIFRRADIAMYAAKASGRNCTVILDIETPNHHA